MHSFATNENKCSAVKSYLQLLKETKEEKEKSEQKKVGKGTVKEGNGKRR
jgi:hypothetical protein